MKILENYLKKIEKCVYFHFKKLHFYYANTKNFYTKEASCFSFKFLDENLEKTKKYTEKEIKAFLRDIEKEDLERLNLLLEIEKIKIEKLMHKNVEDYKSEEYIIYFSNCILIEHLNSLLCNVKKKENLGEKALCEDMFDDLDDYTSEYISAIILSD